MIAKLEFDIDEPEGRKDFTIYSHAMDMYIALWDIHIMLRNKIKYEEGLTDGQMDMLETLKDELNEILRGNKVEFILEG